MNRRRFLKISAATVAASGIGCFAYTVGVEPHWIEVTSRELPIRDLPQSLEGKPLAQLSDLHIGPEVSDSYIVSVFDAIRARKPDIVVFTGDFITYRLNRRDKG